MKYIRVAAAAAVAVVDDDDDDEEEERLILRGGGGRPSPRHFVIVLPSPRRLRLDDGSATSSSYRSMDAGMHLGPVVAALAVIVVVAVLAGGV